MLNSIKIAIVNALIIFQTPILLNTIMLIKFIDNKTLFNMRVTS